MLSLFQSKTKRNFIQSFDYVFRLTCVDFLTILCAMNESIINYQWKDSIDIHHNNNKKCYISMNTQRLYIKHMRGEE